MLLTPIVRSAEWTIAERLKKAFAGILGKPAITLFKPKLSLIIGATPEFDDAGLDSRVEILVCVSKNDTQANSPLARIARATDPYSQLIVLAAVLIDGHSTDKEHQTVRAIAEFHGLPCFRLSVDGSEEQVAQVARGVILHEVETFHRRRGRWRRVVNDWHNDLLSEISSRTSLFGLGCVVEPSLDAIVDLVATRQAGLLAKAAQKGSLNFDVAERYFRQTSADLVVTTPGPLCVPVLVLHIDGRYHNEPQQQRQDTACDELLRSVGLLVCRAKLDTQDVEGEPSRKEGFGTQLYWDRVKDLATVVLSMARDLASPIKQPEIWDQMLTDGLQRVARQDRYLAEDLKFLIGQTIASFGEHVSVVQQAYNELLMTSEPPSPTLSSDQNEASDTASIEDMQEALGRRDTVTLFGLLKREIRRDSSGRRTGLRAFRPSAPNDVLVEVFRPWPDVLVFQGTDQAKATRMFEFLTDTRLANDAVTQLAALPATVTDALAEHYVAELESQKEQIEQRSWNRLSIDERGRRIRDDLLPSAWWISRTRQTFYENNSAADILRTCLHPAATCDWFTEITSTQDHNEVTTTLGERRQRLLRLIARDDSGDDDREYLQLVLHEEFESHLTRLEVWRRMRATSSP